MAQLDELMDAAERYAAGFDAGDLPAAPQRELAIVTCMDARIHPERLFGLEVGDAHVIRNAGGRVTEDALRSLVLSSWLLGARTVLVIHHTKCGVGSPDDAIREAVRDAGGAPPDEMRFHGFSDLEQSVRDDVETIRSSGLLPEGVEVRGSVYDVETAGLRHVEAAS